MTGSSHDLSSRGPARTDRAWLFAPALGVLLAACRAGLPAEPPGADAADPAAAATPYRAPANPYETSAFAGEPTPAADGHAGHGGMDHSKMGHPPTGHGAAEKQATDAETMPAKQPTQGAPR